MATSYGGHAIKLKVPAGEGILTLRTKAKIAEVLPPSNYPDAVIGQVEEGFLIQVPSRERLLLTAVLAASKATKAAEKLVETSERLAKQAASPVIARNSLVGAIGCAAFGSLFFYESMQSEGDDSDLWLLGSGLTTGMGLLFGALSYVTYRRIDREARASESPPVEVTEKTDGRSAANRQPNLGAVQRRGASQ